MIKNINEIIRENLIEYFYLKFAQIKRFQCIVK